MAGVTREEMQHIVHEVGIQDPGIMALYAPVVMSGVNVTELRRVMCRVGSEGALDRRAFADELFVYCNGRKSASGRTCISSSDDSVKTRGQSNRSA